MKINSVKTESYEISAELLENIVTVPFVFKGLMIL
jgi:hypothetical protein